MASNFKHNKKRSTGLIYEFLVRHLASQMIDRDMVGSSKTLKIVKEYFSANTPMGAERELVEAIVTTRAVNETTARRILEEISKTASKMDARILDIKKSNLIKEVHHTFGKKFFDSYRLPQYRLLASIQLYLDAHRRPGRLSENVQKIHLEEGLVKWMTSSLDPNPMFVQDHEIDGLVTTMATKKFEERYGKEFSQAQKGLLELYSRSVLTDDLDVVASAMLNCKKKLMTIMESAQSSDYLKTDPVMKERFDESYQKLGALNISRVDDDTVEEMLLFMKLGEELTSNE